MGQNGERSQIGQITIYVGPFGRRKPVSSFYRLSVLRGGGHNRRRESSILFLSVVWRRKMKGSGLNKDVFWGKV